MNSDLIGTGTPRLQLWAMVHAGFFQSLEFIQTKSIPDTFKGSLPTIEQIEAELGGERG